MVHLGVAAATMAWLAIAQGQAQGPQQAQVVCAERQALLSSLSRQYKENPSALGVANNGALIELLTATDGVTWTLLVTRPDGTSCVLAAGEGWEDLPQVAGGQPL
jgi:hypothetical protein